MSQRRTDVSYTCGWLNETGWDPSPHHVLRGRNLTFALGDYEPFGWSDNNTANLSIGDSADHLVWQGYSVKVLEGVAKLAGFNYSIVWHGDLAQAETVYGVSTYTEFAAQIINDFDIVGSYWIDTSSRRAAGISISHHYMDASGILMVGVNTDNVSIWEEMAVIFNPFTYGLWMLIYAMVVVQAFFAWNLDKHKVKADKESVEKEESTETDQKLQTSKKETKSSTPVLRPNRIPSQENGTRRESGILHAPLFYEPDSPFGSQKSTEPYSQSTQQEDDSFSELAQLLVSLRIDPKHEEWMNQESICHVSDLALLQKEDWRGMIQPNLKRVEYLRLQAHFYKDSKPDGTAVDQHLPAEHTNTSTDIRSRPGSSSHSMEHFVAMMRNALSLNEVRKLEWRKERRHFLLYLENTFCHFTNTGQNLDVNTYYSRMQSIAWGFVVVVILAAYTANLATTLIVDSSSSSTLESLTQAEENGYAVCVEKGSIYATWLKENYPGIDLVYKSSYSDLYEAISSGTCAGAFLESAKTDLALGLYCDELDIVETTYFYAGGGFAVTPYGCGPFILSALNTYLLDMDFNGDLDLLWDDTIDDYAGGSCTESLSSDDDDDDDDVTLGVHSFLGLFMLYLFVSISLSIAQRIEHSAWFERQMQKWSSRKEQNKVVDDGKASSSANEEKDPVS